MNLLPLLGLLLTCLSTVVHAEEVTVLHGQLLDENGMAPLPSQDVYSDSVGTKVTTTDANGCFDYPVKPGQTSVHVLPWSRQIVGRSVMIDVQDFKNEVFRIVVERGVVLRVKVVDPAGVAIDGAKVAWVGSGGASGESGHDGIALVGRISRFKTGDLVVSIKGCKDVKKVDLCAASYVTKEIVMVVPDYPKDVPVEKPKF